MWLQKHKIKPPTATRDIDFAVLISDIEEFDKLSKYLVEKKGFKSFSEAPHRFIFTKNDYIIDLLPFSETGAYYTVYYSNCHICEKQICIEYITALTILNFKTIFYMRHFEEELVLY